MAPFESLRALAARNPLVASRSAAALGISLLVAGTLAVVLLDDDSGSSSLRIEEGESLSRLFARAELSDSDLLAVMEAGHGAAFRLALVPGEEVRIVRREDGRLGRLTVIRGNGEATELVANEAGQFTISSISASDADIASLRDPPVAAESTGNLAGDLLALDAEAPAQGPGADRSLPSPLAALEPRTPDAAPAPVSTTTPVAALDDLPPGEAALERVGVRDGDSLYHIFRRKGLPQGDLLELVSSGREGKQLKRLRPGQSIAFSRGTRGEVVEFHHEVDELTTVRFTRDAEGFTPRVVTRDYDRHVAVKNGVIRSSLFAAADGVPEPIVHELVSVLEWDIDFSRDLRRGDSFSLLYEELRVDGRRVRTGNILALEFKSQRAGEPIRAFRYTDASGHTDYYTPDGHSLRRAFTRNPLRFTRISSRFSKSRLHPVLKVRRPHRGVDYAAPRGTRVRATGEGQVSFVGRKGGYGKTIVLSHGRGYTTLYAHLSRYAKGIRKGVRVSQGQLIGYVGSTGVSTGPHLHYEFRVKGVHRDPLTVELPRTTPLDPQELKRFRNTIAPLMARIDTLGATKLARLDP